MTEVNQIKQLAENGDVEAQYTLGKMHYNGEIDDGCMADAEEWLKKAAEQGHMLAVEQGCANEEGDAQTQFMLAVEQGCANEEGGAQTQFMLAVEQGCANEEGDAQTQFMLGEISSNPAESLNWYNKSAEQDYAPAQYELYKIYYYGCLGLEEDLDEAIRCLAKAAEQGHADAQYWLGDMHDNGEGVEQSDAEALRWYTQAAEQGHVSAKVLLESRERMALFTKKRLESEK